MKKVTIGAKPNLRTRPASPDDWVKARDQVIEPKDQVIEPMKRLTIDVPLSLHTRIKSQCALQNVQMADVIRELLEQRFTT